MPGMDGFEVAKRIKMELAEWKETAKEAGIKAE